MNNSEYFWWNTQNIDFGPFSGVNPEFLYINIQDCKIIDNYIILPEIDKNKERIKELNKKVSKWK